jgi:queuine/archaeosine tRNA-ribosyltransferase
MCQQLPYVETRCCQASENRAYVRRLLREREPVFLALLQYAERQIEIELASGHRQSAVAIHQKLMTSTHQVGREA